MRKTRTPPWKKKNPRKGKRAGRRYPNLVDNMWSSTHPSAGRRSRAR